MSPESPLVSIVMPAYGVASYLADAIADVRGQTVQDWELIVVDDHSPDDGARIALAAAEEDPRIHVLSHRENQGVAAARNTGIAFARGSWLWMPDPDDRYEPDFLEVMLAAAERTDAQMVVSGYVEEYHDQTGRRTSSRTLSPGDGDWRGDHEFRDHVIDLERGTFLGYPWNKLYDLGWVRSSGARFQEIHFVEDILFNLDVIRRMRTMTTVAAAPYHYEKRVASNLTNQYDPRYYQNHCLRVTGVRDVLDEWGCLDRRAAGILGGLYARYVLSALERNCDRGSRMTGADRRAWCREVFASDIFGELIPQATAESASVRVCVAILRTRSQVASRALGRTIHVVRSGLKPLYDRLKQGR